MQHTWIFEYLIHQNLIHSQTTVKDPKDADLFFVPIYFGAFNSNNGLYSKKVHMNNVIQELKRVGPWIEDNGGVDHVYTQILMQYEKNIYENQKNVPSMLTTGDILFEYTKRMPREAWRLTQVPYSSNSDDYENETRRLNPLFFIGEQTLEGRADTKTKRMRKELVKVLSKMRNSVIYLTKEKKISSMFDSNSFMKKSQFCLIPSSEIPTSKRLYDAYKARCIPIIASDDARFPFENLFFDYSNTVLQIPMADVKMLPIVTGVVREKHKREMRERINELGKLLTLDFNMETHNGDLIWAWKWSQYFKAATIAASKRRDFVKNRFYTPINKPNITKTL